MKIDVNEKYIQAAHEEAAAIGRELGVVETFNRMAERYVNGHWKRFVPKLELFSKPLKGGVFVDYGCKFGHLTPMLIDQGVKEIYAIDVDRSYLDAGRQVFGSKYPVNYVQSENCYVDIPSNSADFILTNEVISHINPKFLDTYYAEAARILKPNGQLVISDGNNWMHLQTRLDLLEWYSLWESGTSKEFGDANYIKRRTAMIAKEFPDLKDEDLAHVAKNTSGLWGEEIIDAVRRFKEGNFVERPHRPGVYPTHPTHGVVMERAFDPVQVIRALETYGLKGNQVLRGKEIADFSKIGETKNFTIRATKLPETIEDLQDHARATLVNEPEAFPRHLTATDSELIGKGNLLIKMRERAKQDVSLRNKVREIFFPNDTLDSEIGTTLRLLATHKKAAERDGRKQGAKDIALVIKMLQEKSA